MDIIEDKTNEVAESQAMSEGIFPLDLLWKILDNSSKTDFFFFFLVVGRGWKWELQGASVVQSRGLW